MALPAIDRNQLPDSIDKLFHYLLVHVKHKTRVEIEYKEEMIYNRVFEPPTEVQISPLLYTRLDDCHGAGNCCRVPFDLVYTEFCVNRIVEYDYGDAEVQFGSLSAEIFRQNREKLIATLERLDVHFTIDYGHIGKSWAKPIWVQRNRLVNPLSDTQSCPYLFVGDDRYYCGVHPFKPLHCWYPHMTVRKNDASNSVSIGRMQYGRNHKFGCPVLFKEPVVEDQSQLFVADADDRVSNGSYFDSQFNSDLDKLRWTAAATASLGFDSNDNFAVDLPDKFLDSVDGIKQNLTLMKKNPITLWRK